MQRDDEDEDEDEGILWIFVVVVQHNHHYHHAQIDKRAKWCRCPCLQEVCSWQPASQLAPWCNKPYTKARTINKLCALIICCKNLKKNNLILCKVLLHTQSLGLVASSCPAAAVVLFHMGVNPNPWCCCSHDDGLSLMFLVVAYSLHAYWDHSWIGSWGTIESPECQGDATAAADDNDDDDVLLVWNVIATCAAPI